MANYHYDEGGNMAAYFVLSFLALILIPLSLSFAGSSKKETLTGCQCQPCIDQRARISKHERGSLLKPNMGKKAIATLIGWSIFGYLAYKVTNAKIDNKVYDPFEILGLRSGVTEKEIKSHFKKLSRLYHPDKVKPTGNDTLESIANHFVDITKAYKSLTDETIRKNWEQYGHPDGRQEVSTGIALPAWIVEGKNNIWVLGVYGLLVGGALPALVGRWWFGSREKTKDGVKAQTAAAFFKSLTEESGMLDVVGSLGKSYAWERAKVKTGAKEEMGELEGKVEEKLGREAWREVRKLADSNGEHETRRRALVLLYAHLLRIPVSQASLQKEQADILLQTPALLNALLNIATARNWLAPSLSIMRLHAYLAQALQPGNEKLRFAQLPGIGVDSDELAMEGAEALEDVVDTLEKRGDGRLGEVKKAAQSWGRLELVDAAFKVIGERIVTPSSIVFLVLKLRISPPGLTPKENVDHTKPSKANEEKDLQFLTSRKDAEDLSPLDGGQVGWAHAPYWPGNRKPSWWLVLADDKSSKLVVPPMKMTDVPYSNPDSERDYRSYKLQFQAPQTVGLFTWKIYLVSDTFIGEEIMQDLALKIEEMPTLNTDEQDAEDEISDPEEDTLAGQMAAMRGGAVKRRPDGDVEESDDESGTDDDEKSGGSSSDSDSD